MHTLQKTRHPRNAAPDWRLKPVASGALAVVLAVTLVPGQGWAQLVGGRVVAGAATINPSGVNTTINQATQNAIIQYNSFNVPGGTTVRFNVPNGGATLNRVNAGNPSAIHGTISSNGAVFLINPNGILVSSTGMIDATRFVASTRDIDNAAFMAGGALAFKGNGDGTVINLGTIKASSGDVLLFGSRVEHAGSISAPAGQVTLAAGDRLLLAPTPMSRIAVEGVSVAGGVKNSGLIEAAQARVIAAGGVYAMAINQTGVIKASGTLNSAGTIVIDGSDVRVSGRLQAASGTTSGVRVEITGDILALVGADVSAHNANDGGTIFVGGGWQGKDTAVRNAQSVSVDSSSVLNASAAIGAQTSGKGGTVAVWSDGQTQFAGRNLALGGAAGGDGGSVEVSGKKRLVYNGSTDTRAPKGKTGSLLLDPEDICITNGASCLYEADPMNPTWSVLSGSTLVNDLANNDVNISTNASASGNGDISWEFSLSSGAANKLTLIASRDVKVLDGDMTTSGKIELSATRDITIGRSVYGQASGGTGIALSAGRNMQIGVLGDSTDIIANSGDISIMAGGNVRLGTGTANTGGNAFAKVATNGTGKINIAATGSVTIESKAGGPKVLQSASDGVAVSVRGSSFVNNTGTDAIAITDPAGRWIVGSGSRANDSVGGLVSHFRQYNATLGTTALAQSTGNGFLYTEAPTITASLTGSTSKTYDGTNAATLAAANFSKGGVLNGDTVTLSTPTSGTFDNKNAGTGKLVTATGVSIASATNGVENVYGYTMASSSASGNIGTIDRRTLNASFTGTNRVYDGLTAAAVTASSDKVLGDTLTVANTGAAFANKNVGAAKAIAVSGVSISGTDAGNYTLVSTSSTAQANITRRSITATADDKNITAGQPDPALTYRVTSGTVVAGDTLNGALARAAGTTAASYAINQGSLTSANNSNYDVGFVPGALRIAAAPIETSIIINITIPDFQIATQTIGNANVTPQNIAQQTLAIVKPPPLPPTPPVTLWSDMRFNTLAEALAYQKTPEFLKQANPNNLPACTDPVLVTCFRPTPPGYTPVFNGSTLTSQYSLGGFGASIAKFQVSASEEWVNMPAIARETVRPANAVQTGPAVTNPNTPNTGYLARELIAPDVRPTTFTGLPVELAAVEQRLMASWAVKNLTATELTQFRPTLTPGVDYTLTTDKPPKLLAMLDTPRMKEALASQFRAREEIAQAKGAGGSYRASRDGSALESTAEANRNRGDLAMALFAEAAVAFQVKPENRSKEQQELVTYMYSYMAKEAKDTYIQAKAEYTAWTLDTTQGDSNARGDGVMMLFGNVGGQHKAPPKHLMDQAVAGMNMTAAESSNFQNALAGSLSAGVSLAAGAATAAAVGAAMGTQAVALAITPFAQILASGAGEATELLVGQFLGLTGGATGGALSVAGIGVALVAAAITGVVTDAVHQADGEKMMQYFRKPGPDMSWMNALTSGNLVEQQAAMARMMAYTTKMVSAY